MPLRTRRHRGLRSCWPSGSGDRCLKQPRSAPRSPAIRVLGFNPVDSARITAVAAQTPPNGAGTGSAWKCLALAITAELRIWAFRIPGHNCEGGGWRLPHRPGGFSGVSPRAWPPCARAGSTSMHLMSVAVTGAIPDRRFPELPHGDGALRRAEAIEAAGGGAGSQGDHSRWRWPLIGGDQETRDWSLGNACQPLLVAIETWSVSARANVLPLDARCSAARVR